MKYNFDEIIERRGTGSYKWDSTNDQEVLPMWVADMDFRVAQPIIDALIKRTEHGVFGYSIQVEEYYNAIINWFERRHDWKIDRNWISHSPGIVPALHFFTKVFVKPGDKIMMHSPVYYPFFGSASRNNIEVVFNRLIYNGGRYEIDFCEFERIARDPSVKAFYLCSPHNPGGRIWSREELERMGKICTDNGVLVVADEIHCDLVYPGRKHVPYGTLPGRIADNSIICVAPSKTFNLAGLQTSCLIMRDAAIKKQYDRFLASLGIMRPNAYGIVGMTAAYTHGDEWLDQLISYLNDNLTFLKDYLKNNIPQVKIMEPDATYLVWMNFSELKIDGKTLHDILLKEGKVWLDEGYIFGEAGEGFERINIACPRSVLEEGLNRIRDSLKAAGLV